MLRRVALVRTDVSEELSNRRTLRRNTASVASYIVPSSPIVTLMMEALSSSKTLVLTRATWRNIPEDTILHSLHHENLKSYKEFLFSTLRSPSLQQNESLHLLVQGSGVATAMVQLHFTPTYSS
jgi:hypothetical protein